MNLSALEQNKVLRRRLEVLEDTALVRRLANSLASIKKGKLIPRKEIGL